MFLRGQTNPLITVVQFPDWVEPVLVVVVGELIVEMILFLLFGCKVDKTLDKLNRTMDEVHDSYTRLAIAIENLNKTLDKKD